mgnify:CR=1 FL=1
MQKRRFLLLSVLTGILLSGGWYSGFTGLVLLIAFIPLLYVEEYFLENKERFTSFQAVKYAFLSFLIWNILTSWWIKNASVFGVVAAVLINTTLMSLVFWLSHISGRKLGRGFGYFALLVFWISFEHFYINGEISWPWLTLGYGFANDIIFVQWYEYTGSLGGTLWVLLANVVLFRAVKARISPLHSYKKGTMVAALLVVFVPIIISLVRFYTYENKGTPHEIVVVQPNIDPYKKFVALSSEEQTGIMVRLADSLATANTSYIVAPETAINNNIWLEKMKENQDIQMIKNFIDTKYPAAKFIVGITSYLAYADEGSASHTARPLGSSGQFYDSFNTSIQIDTTEVVQYYHKSKLVVGVEKMPYPQYLKFLRKLTLQLGGAFRSHGTQENRISFISPQDSTGIGTAICYESIFGEFVTEYIKSGTNLLFIITNDGWWGDTPGYRQHNAFAALRAIETRKSIARSANTGISSFFDQRGEMLQKLGWWQRGAIKETLYANEVITFYTRHGDYIARVSYFFALVVLVYLLVRVLMERHPHARTTRQTYK